MEATEEQFEQLCKDCERILKSNEISTFSQIIFVDFSKYLNTFEKKFPKLNFKLTTYGITITRKTKSKENKK